jgi:hypothetical protein
MPNTNSNTTTAPPKASAPAPLRITLRTTYAPHSGAATDAAEATHNGRTFQARSRHGATMKLARILREAGCADQPWEAYGHDGRSRLMGSSLHGLAGLTVQESNTQGLRIAPYSQPAFPLNLSEDL